MKKMTLIILFIYSSGLKAQPNKDLHLTISKLDSVFFKAFNNCNLEKYESFLTYDYEFYHDKQGLTVSKKNEMESMLTFCGDQRKRQHIRRELVKNSFEVFPLNNYGAIATGEHLFYIVVDKQTSKLVSKAKFTTVWRFDNNEWKISRTLSYNHIAIGQVQLDNKTLTSYEGDYRVNSERIINIKKEGKILRIKEGEWNSELLPESKKTFYLNQNNVQVKFYVEENKIIKLAVYENNKLVEEAIKM